MKPSAFAALSAMAALAAALAARAQSGSVGTQIEGLTFRGKPVTVEEVATGRDVYAANCASCHGANLQGQPNWKRRLANGRMPAPPHDASGHTWHHSDRDLFLMVKGGIGAIVPGYQSDMPAFGGTLTDNEIADVLIYIKSTWPERQRKVQAAISARDKGGP